MKRREYRDCRMQKIKIRKGQANSKMRMNRIQQNKILTRKRKKCSTLIQKKSKKKKNM